MTVYDHRRCELGEGPLWHPLRGELFWFDILEGRLHSRGPEGETSRDLGEMASAAGWVDRDRLLDADVAQEFLSALMALPKVKRLLSSEHFSVDGTLIDAWAMVADVLTFLQQKLA